MKHLNKEIDAKFICLEGALKGSKADIGREVE